MNCESRIKRHVSQARSPVVLRSDLRKLGYSSSSLTAALNALIADGLLVRIGVGVYAKAKSSVLSGQPIPVEPLEVLAPIALRKLGVKVEAARSTCDYNSGRTTQVPVGVVVNVGKRRTPRRIGFNGKFVQYERA